MKENVRSVGYSRGFLYSQHSLTKWIQLVNYYTVRSREKLLFWFSWFSFPHFPLPTSSINFWFEFTLINLASKQFENNLGCENLLPSGKDPFGICRMWSLGENCQQLWTRLKRVQISFSFHCSFFLSPVNCSSTGCHWVSLAPKSCPGVVQSLSHQFLIILSTVVVM